jgi:hypothetical protein
MFARASNNILNAGSSISFYAGMPKFIKAIFLIHPLFNKSKYY